MANTGLVEKFPFINGDHGSMKYRQRKISFSSGKKDEVGSDIGTQEKSEKGNSCDKFPGCVKKIK